VTLAPTRVATGEPPGTAFAGELIIAPVMARGSLWMRRFAEHSSAFASGWMRIRGARRRRGYERGFVLSDHADWPSLLEAVAACGAQRVFVTHGLTAPLARYLSARGFDAHVWSTHYEGEPEAE
jgi:putative mRNA 3-end processing factor